MSGYLTEVVAWGFTVIRQTHKTLTEKENFTTTTPSPPPSGVDCENKLKFACATPMKKRNISWTFTYLACFSLHS